MKSNSGFISVPQSVKTNGFIDLVGTIDNTNNDGYEWFWSASNGFKLKLVKNMNYNDDDSNTSRTTVRIML